MKTFLARVLPLTGVHIGTGEQITPLEYGMFRISGNKAVFMRFLQEAVILSLKEPGRKALMKAIDTNNFRDLRKILLENGIPKSSVLYSLPVTSTFKALYDEHKDNPKNQLLVNGMFRTGTAYVPVLPGSSLKGAIRTAVLDELASVQPGAGVVVGRGQNDDRSLQQSLLGYNDPKNDPFRAVHVRDCSISGSGCALIGTMNMYRRRSGEGYGFESLNILTEVVRGTLLDGDASGEVEVRIDSDLAAIRKEIPRWTPPGTSISLSDIIRSCNRYYRSVFEDEYTRFYLSGEEPAASEGALRLKLIIDAIDERKGECLLRVGRFSQVESVTLERFRQPNAPRGYGKTRTLFEYNGNYYPLGWLKLSFDLPEQAAATEQTARRFVLKAKR